MPKAPEYAAAVVAEALAGGLVIALFYGAEEVAYTGYQRINTTPDQWQQTDARAENSTLIRFPASAHDSDTPADSVHLYASDGSPLYLLPLPAELIIRNNDAPVFDPADIAFEES